MHESRVSVQWAIVVVMVAQFGVMNLAYGLESVSYSHSIQFPPHLMYDEGRMFDPPSATVNMPKFSPHRGILKGLVLHAEGHVVADYVMTMQARMSRIQLEVRWLLRSESYALLSFLATSCS
jgi:hypothetical protein